MAVFRGFDHSACVAAFPARSYAEPSCRAQQFTAFLCLTGRPGRRSARLHADPILQALHPRPHPRLPGSSNTIALASMASPRAVMLRALPLCILARREHNSVLHMLSATPTCYPYWWCAGAGITLERPQQLRHENRCRCPYTYVSLRVLLCTTFC